LQIRDIFNECGGGRCGLTEPMLYQTSEMFDHDQASTLRFGSNDTHFNWENGSFPLVRSSGNYFLV
jgi:hypothetical protein